MPVKSQITGLIELQSILDKLETLENDAKSYLRNIISKGENKAALIRFNIQNLQQGIRPDDTPIEKTPYGRQVSTKYERYTIYLKNKRGDIVDENSPVTLHGKTGEFWADIDVVVGSNTIYMIDRDPKAEELQITWGQVIGIADEQLREFSEMLLPDIENFLERRFKNG